MAGGPSVPPRNLSLPTPPLPTTPHPGTLPPITHITLAEKAYMTFGEYETARMRAFAHLRMPAPFVEILPPKELRSDPTYNVRLEVPDCGSCHEQQARLKHVRYLELYHQVPFLHPRRDNQRHNGRGRTPW